MKSPKSPKSPTFRKLCCFSTTEDSDPPADEDAINGVAQDVQVAQEITQPTTDVVAALDNCDVDASAEETKKGHKRTPSEASTPVAPFAPVIPIAKPPTPKVSRSSSSTSSYKSSDSVQTAFERSPRMIREESMESVVTAIERTPSPKASKKEDEDSKGASLDSQTEQVSLQSPSSQQSQTSLQSPAQSSQESSASKGMSEDFELPEGVTSLDEVKKLNEIIDNEKYELKHPFWDKISLFYGDITKIQVDAIVNAANDRLGGGGGVDGAIHRAAGHNQLQAECRKHDRPVPTGEAVVTEACKLSSYVKKIIHCVGPICYGGVTDEKRKKLESCYRRAIQLSEENDLRSIAFCCISTGIYGYDNKDAARTVLRFLWQHFNKEENVEKWDRVVLCLFMDIDKKCYKHYIRQLLEDPSFFDDEEEESEDEDTKKEDDEKKEEEGEKKDDKEKKEEEGEGERKEEDENAETKKENDEKKDEKKTNEGDEKDETDSKESMKTNENEKAHTKDDGNMTEKKDDTESKTDESTVEEESSKEEATTSSSSTSASEQMGEESDGGKGEGEKENRTIDSNEKVEEGVTTMKRGLSEERADEPPFKRDKPERESAV